MEIVNIIAMVAALGTFGAATVAAITYYRNTKLERAKWSLGLYEKFYEQPHLIKRDQGNS
ncbi:MAG: hypothetical protein ACT4O9_11955 [Blastocatellia bacterium]